CSTCLYIIQTTQPVSTGNGLRRRTVAAGQRKDWRTTVRPTSGRPGPGRRMAAHDSGEGTRVWRAGHALFKREAAEAGPCQSPETAAAGAPACASANSWYRLQGLRNPHSTHTVAAARALPGLTRPTGLI